ncbi:MAG: hypothetical protein MT490_11750 [Sphingomonas sp.]|uniref:hypothetical protein n=1 Tax=Sphingomonas sp. TaxID=28214 RepID=UPI002272DB79|nr:hypothetical protein [Sphingomonas sp.]MCX8476460.1 hypothetical protein [Sphingomonas sp.]
MNDMKYSMKSVFELADELRANPARVELTQALTLNASKPSMGLKGSMGLFGSPEWWEHIGSGMMPSKRFSGVIERAYYAGQGGTGPNNMVDIITDEGRPESIGIYVNNPADVQLFKIGHRVEIVYALDELKQQPGPDGEVNYSKVAVKMAVSTQPVK